MVLRYIQMPDLAKTYLGTNRDKRLIVTRTSEPRASRYCGTACPWFPARHTGCPPAGAGAPDDLCQCSYFYLLVYLLTEACCRGLST